MVEEFFKGLLGHAEGVHSAGVSPGGKRVVLKATLALRDSALKRHYAIIGLEAGLRKRLLSQFGHLPDRNKGVRLTVNFHPSGNWCVVTLSASRTRVEKAALASFTRQVQAAEKLLRAHSPRAAGAARDRRAPGRRTG